MDLVEVYTTSVAKIQSWTETASTHALSFERQRCQAAADNESSVLQDKHNAVFKQYAAWCSYLQQFCAALQLFHEMIDDRSMEGFLECCEQTTQTIKGLLSGVTLSEAHEAHMRYSAEFLDGLIEVLRGRQEHARKTQEERERDEEREAILRERIVHQSNEDFWEEYDKLSSESLDPIERKVLLEERTRRKAGRAQGSLQESWREKPAMAEEDEQGTQEERSKRRDMNDWQAQRLLSRSMLRQIMQELVEEELRDSKGTILTGQQVEEPQLQLQNVTIADEAWHVKRIAGQDGRIAELQRYANRVVQYLTYSILGQHADQVLARIKGCKFSELLLRYEDCLKVVGWSDHNPFLDVQLIEALIYAFTQADNDSIMDVALAMHKNLQVLLQLQTNVGDERIPYSSLRATSTIIIADANAGFATTKHDWCGMGAFLQSYAQYRDVQELNRAKILDFAGARCQLGPALASPERGTTFHIFW
jgi:hypothetical protein